MICKCGCGKYPKKDTSEYCQGHNPIIRESGWTCSEETKNKMRLAHTGVTHSTETKKLCSEQKKGKTLEQLGHKDNCSCCMCRAKYGRLTKEEILTMGSKSGKSRLGKKLSNSHIRNMLKAGCKHPNKFETNALNYLNIIYGGKFKYTGDGSFIVNHRSADAYSEELNAIALFHGVYWHLKIKGLKITEKNKRSVEKVDSLPFLSSGYKVIFIWEDEINKLIEVNNV